MKLQISLNTHRCQFGETIADKMEKKTLVVLALVVSCAVRETTADCQHIAGDILIRQVTTIQPTYPVGRGVRYECRLPGYRIAGQKSNTRVRKTIRCLATNEFNQARPCCEKIHCKSLPAGTNTVPVPTNVDAPINSQYTYICLLGYSTLDATVTTCLDGAVWSLPTGPNCQKISCGKPADGTNTETVPTATNIQFMGLYVYECLEGYTTTDPTAVVCQADGTFSSPAPTCTLTDACASSPCQNGGTCVSGAGGYTCLCPNLFQGVNCEEVNPCGSSPCANGGICTNGAGGTFTCVCAPGYSGPFCMTSCVSPWQPAGSGCYQAFETPTTWTTARANCITVGGVLAQPKTVADLTALSSGFPSLSFYYWLGGGQLITGTDVNFTWLDGAIVTVTTPSNAALTSASQDMIIFIRAGGSPNYSLQSAESTAQYKYICQK